MRAVYKTVSVLFITELPRVWGSRSDVWIAGNLTGIRFVKQASQSPQSPASQVVTKFSSVPIMILCIETTNVYQSMILYVKFCGYTMLAYSIHETIWSSSEILSIG